MTYIGIYGVSFQLDSAPTLLFLCSSRHYPYYLMQGDSSVPVWSGVNVAGIPILEELDKTGESKEWKNVHSQVSLSSPAFFFLWSSSSAHLKPTIHAYLYIYISLSSPVLPLIVVPPGGGCGV